MDGLAPRQTQFRFMPLQKPKVLSNKDRCYHLLIIFNRRYAPQFEKHFWTAILQDSETQKKGSDLADSLAAEQVNCFT